MSNDQIILLVTIIPISLLLLVFSIILLQGKGANLIAGYNTMSKEKKARYDTIAMCKFMGKVLLILNALFVGFMLGIMFECWIISWICAGLFLVVTIFILVYANTNNRFKKSDAIQE